MKPAVILDDLIVEAKVAILEHLSVSSLLQLKNVNMCFYSLVMEALFKRQDAQAQKVQHLLMQYWFNEPPSYFLNTVVAHLDNENKRFWIVKIQNCLAAQVQTTIQYPGLWYYFWLMAHCLQVANNTELQAVTTDTLKACMLQLSTSLDLVPQQGDAMALGRTMEEVKILGDNVAALVSFIQPPDASDTINLVVWYDTLRKYNFTLCEQIKQYKLRRLAYFESSFKALKRALRIVMSRLPVADCRILLKVCIQRIETFKREDDQRYEALLCVIGEAVAAITLPKLSKTHYKTRVEWLFELLSDRTPSSVANDVYLRQILVKQISMIARSLPRIYVPTFSELLLANLQCEVPIETHVIMCMEGINEVLPQLSEMQRVSCIHSLLNLLWRQKLLLPKDDFFESRMRIYCVVKRIVGLGLPIEVYRSALAALWVQHNSNQRTLSEIIRQILNVIFAKLYGVPEKYFNILLVWLDLRRRKSLQLFREACELIISTAEQHTSEQCQQYLDILLPMLGDGDSNSEITAPFIVIYDVIRVMAVALSPTQCECTLDVLFVQLEILILREDNAVNTSSDEDNAVNISGACCDAIGALLAQLSKELLPRRYLQRLYNSVILGRLPYSYIFNNTVRVLPRLSMPWFLNFLCQFLSSISNSIGIFFDSKDIIINMFKELPEVLYQPCFDEMIRCLDQHHAEEAPNIEINRVIWLEVIRIFVSALVDKRQVPQVFWENCMRILVDRLDKETDARLIEDIWKFVVSILPKLSKTCRNDYLNHLLCCSVMRNSQILIRFCKYIEQQGAVASTTFDIFFNRVVPNLRRDNVWIGGTYAWLPTLPVRYLDRVINRVEGQENTGRVWQDFCAFVRGVKLFAHDVKAAQSISSELFRTQLNYLNHHNNETRQFANLYMGGWLFQLSQPQFDEVVAQYEEGGDDYETLTKRYMVNVCGILRHQLAQQLDQSAKCFSSSSDSVMSESTTAAVSSHTMGFT